MRGIVDRVTNPDPPLPADPEDLRGLARGLRLLVEMGARALAEDAGSSPLALRVTGHLGCAPNAAGQGSGRLAAWEHVNIQRGVDAYLAARHEEPQWFGPSGAGHRPHEDLLSLIGSPSPFGPARLLARSGMRGRAGAAERGG